ncbi:hypothetical protein ACLOJK_008719 [Asimina triloba]
MAERVFGEMKEAGIEPNAAQITHAHEVFREMLDVGCTPNVVMFNNLMRRVHAKAQRTEKVLQVYNQMKRMSCTPDVGLE